MTPQEWYGSGLVPKPDWFPKEDNPQPSMSAEEWYEKLQTDPLAHLSLPKRTATAADPFVYDAALNVGGRPTGDTGETYREQKRQQSIADTLTGETTLPLPGQSPGLSISPLTGQEPTAVTNKAGQSFPDYFFAEKAKGIQDLFTGPQRAYQKGMTLDEEIAWSQKASQAAMGGGMPMAQKGAAGIFGGRLSAGANLQDLALAEQMFAKGMDRRQIWDATGWFQGKDGKWRYEIPDKNFIVNYGWDRGISGPGVAHPGLKEAYGFKELTHDIIPADVEMGAYYSPSSIAPGGHINVAGTTIEENMIHELMHAVQQKEGFARGGSFQSIYELALKRWEKESPGITKTTKGRDEAKQAAREVYNRLAGEVEARNVEKRLKMSPEERKRIPPWETEDRPRSMQQVLFSKPPFAQKIKPVTGPIESDPNFVYHATNIERAQTIAETGKLGRARPHEYTDQTTWPDGSTERRNYFTPTAQNTWQFAPEEGTPVLVRIKKDTHSFKKESTGDLYSTKDISAKNIEILTESGWIPLSEAVKK